MNDGDGINIGKESMVKKDAIAIAVGQYVWKKPVHH